MNKFPMERLNLVVPPEQLTFESDTLPPAQAGELMTLVRSKIDAIEKDASDMATTAYNAASCETEGEAKLCANQIAAFMVTWAVARVIVAAGKIDLIRAFLDEPIHLQTVDRTNQDGTVPPPKAIVEAIGEEVPNYCRDIICAFFDEHEKRCTTSGVPDTACWNARIAVVAHLCHTLAINRTHFCRLEKEIDFYDQRCPGRNPNCKHD